MSMGYMEIADELERQIASGALPLGSNVPSRREICERFNVSNVTAARVHDELSARNLVLKIRGSGVEVLGPFIPPSQKAIYPVIRKLSFLHNNKSGVLHGSQVLISDYLQQEAEKRGVEYRAEFGEILSYAGVRNALKSLDPGNAYVLSVQPAMQEKMLLSNLAMLNPNIHTVLLDGVIPQSYCVICDNYAGMLELVKYVYDRGCRNILYVNHFYSLGNNNASERYYGCRTACRMHGIRFRVIDTANYEDVLACLSSTDVPDAVMCSQDAIAVRLLRMMDQQGLKNYPLVTGFDGSSVIGSDSRVTTIRLDRERMAAAAAEIVFTRPLNPIIYDVIRIPGILTPMQK